MPLRIGASGLRNWWDSAAEKYAFGSVGLLQVDGTLLQAQGQFVGWVISENDRATPFSTLTTM